MVDATPMPPPPPDADELRRAWHERARADGKAYEFQNALPLPSRWTEDTICPLGSAPRKFGV